LRLGSGERFLANQILNRAANPHLPGDDRFLRWVTFAGCGAFLLQQIAYNFVDIDIWHQMALIRESLSAGHLLRADVFAYTPTLPAWIDHEWGAGALAYFGTSWLGSRTILVLKFLLALGTGWACLRCAQARGADFRLLGVCAPLAIFLAHLGFLATIRAQAYTFFLTALWLLLLEMDRRGARSWIIAGLAIFPLWVNLHAGFVVALGLTGLHALEQLLRREPMRHLLFLLGAMFLEIFLNPYGIGYFAYLRRALLMSRPYSPEWGPVWGLGGEWTVAFIATGLIAVYAAFSVGWQRAPGLFVLAATAVEAGIHRKQLPLFAVAWLCYVPAYLQQTAEGKWWTEFAQRKRRFLAVAWTAVVCICAFGAVRQKPWDLNVPQPLYPVGAVQYLAQQKFAGNLMTPFRVGAYVSWKLYPAVKVGLDSRYEVAYPDAVVRQVFDFYGARGDWRSTLRDFTTDAVLIPTDAPVSEVMQATGWGRVYIDRQFEIYARQGIPLAAQDWSSITFRGAFP
jgi:hypothetical protein